MGDISRGSAATIHRGLAHSSPIARPVLVLGVDDCRPGWHPGLVGYAHTQSGASDGHDRQGQIEITGLDSSVRR
ncbi:hypothetical protein JMJ56_31415 [Belnapia sp. T18]|uniref:Uncharacterized protein n=1 Tax=Belnapia arida TaxID=2804533 RepID=A0ABS1UFK2_9PROT|nr:hypothetical protein [Belnapia arida]MBL6082477.1 hypothetical protein [Belnapia arida]